MPSKKEKKNKIIHISVRTLIFAYLGITTSK